MSKYEKKELTGIDIMKLISIDCDKRPDMDYILSGENKKKVSNFVMKILKDDFQKGEVINQIQVWFIGELEKNIEKGEKELLVDADGLVKIFNSYSEYLTERGSLE